MAYEIDINAMIKQRLARKEIEDNPALLTAEKGLVADLSMDFRDTLAWHESELQRLQSLPSDDKLNAVDSINYHRKMIKYYMR